jgi:integrase/recombinase XerC
MKAFAAAPARSHTLPRASRATHSKTPLTSSFSEKVQITLATELANSEVSVYTLMKLLGHESMVSAHVTAAGTAAAQNTLYGLLADN